ncbi:hypothetical protein D3C76_1577630 [compost metagenome]
MPLQCRVHCWAVGDDLADLRVVGVIQQAVVAVGDEGISAVVVRMVADQTVHHAVFLQMDRPAHQSEKLPVRAEYGP